MLADWDAALFRAIHHGMHHRWLDPVMMALTDPGRWKVPLLALFALVFLLRGRRGAIAVVVLSLTIAASDQLSSHVLKPVFRRARPSVSLHDAKPLFGVRTSWSFPSSHASNFFAAAPVAAAAIPQAAIPAYALASVVSLSRIYVGDHYPSDVLGGAILGLFLGFLGRKAFFRSERSILGRARAPAGVDEGTSIRQSRGERAPSGGP
ncbi:MAG: phosphatase PAP2 family protein [Candidatus Eisenbacteria bacterium]|uniref:Phosphatase PAP2 family protein n=1 Tax=Eiseniibacteriota bacterium TaxID=2212470 RepID=A0A538T9U6_UNCEI|nr:MAG: phosphatase PAP2 family protein [Candidatus Eisenbacteria bacterium]